VKDNLISLVKFKEDSMFSYIAKRFLLLMPVILILSMLTFFLSSLSAGDTARMLAEQKYGVPTLEQIEKVRIEEGFDEPTIKQYLRWLFKVFNGDLGYSYQSKKPVWDELMSRFPITMKISFISIIIIMVTAIPIGILSALYPDRLIDKFARVFSFFSVSTPSFWLGMMLLYIFGARLKVVSVLNSGSGKFPILPAIAAAIPFMGVTISMMRNKLIEVMDQGYIRALRGKGLSETKIVIFHGFRNAVLPVLTKLGMIFGALICGSSIVESIFSVPGVGKYILEMMAIKDLPVIQ